MRLSLLRSPMEPDPEGDQGQHEFTYAIAPHVGDWRELSIPSAHELNSPIIAVPLAVGQGLAYESHTFAEPDLDNVIIDTVKRAEDSDDIIIRMYEAYGQRGLVNIQFGRRIASASECDLMEENDQPVAFDGSRLFFDIKPYEIRTFRMAFRKD